MKRDLSRAAFQATYGPSGFEKALEEAGLDDGTAISARDLGEVVTDHRSSWVRRFRVGATEVFVKTYDYPTLRDRLRGAFRNTWFAPSRAAREWDGLRWLRARGFEAPEPLAYFELRRALGLRRAVLVTAAQPGHRLDELLPSLSPDDRDALLTRLEHHVEALHAAGFRHRNLDLRNLLARHEDDEWHLVTLDCPRHRTVAAGPAHDRLARADWDRLARSLSGHS